MWPYHIRRREESNNEISTVDFSRFLIILALLASTVTGLCPCSEKIGLTTSALRFTH
jgi:hypothetical protein